MFILKFSQFVSYRVIQILYRFLPLFFKFHIHAIRIYLFCLTASVSIYPFIIMFLSVPFIYSLAYMLHILVIINHVQYLFVYCFYHNFNK